MKNGFYTELDALRRDDPEADFGFLENTYVTGTLNASFFLHGLCADFAATLSDIYGYQIESVHHRRCDGCTGKLIHAYCVTEFEGQTAYIDIRGITTDPKLFFEEFENEITYYPEDGELWDLDDPAVVKSWENKDKFLDGDYEGWEDKGIKDFVRENNSYYNVSALQKKMSLADRISQAISRTASSQIASNPSKEHSIFRR